MTREDWIDNAAPPALRDEPDWIYIDANHAEEECYTEEDFPTVVLKKKLV